MNQDKINDQHRMLIQKIYKPSRLHVVGKTTHFLQGGNAGSQEDFAKRFKSQEKDLV